MNTLSKEQVIHDIANEIIYKLCNEGKFEYTYKNEDIEITFTEILVEMLEKAEDHAQAFMKLMMTGDKTDVCIALQDELDEIATIAAKEVHEQMIEDAKEIEGVEKYLEALNAQR